MFSLVQNTSKCTFGRGSVTDPGRGAHNTAPDSLAGFKGATLAHKEEGKVEKEQGKWRGKVKREKERQQLDFVPFAKIPGCARASW